MYFQSRCSRINKNANVVPAKSSYIIHYLSVSDHWLA